MAYPNDVTVAPLTLSVLQVIKKEGYEVIMLELMLLDISRAPYCQDVFEKCTKTLMMSAIIRALPKSRSCTRMQNLP